MTIVNTAILKNPVNWIIVLLMLVLAGTAGHFMLSWIGQEPATGS